MLSKIHTLSQKENDIFTYFQSDQSLVTDIKHYKSNNNSLAHLLTTEMPIKVMLRQLCKINITF